MTLVDDHEEIIRESAHRQPKRNEYVGGAFNMANASINVFLISTDMILELPRQYLTIQTTRTPSRTSAETAT